MREKTRGNEMVAAVVDRVHHFRGSVRGVEGK